MHDELRATHQAPCAAFDSACGILYDPPMAERLLVRNLFLRVLAALLFADFWSLHSQVLVLLGSDGLAPACSALALASAEREWWELPTLLRIGCDDQLLLGLTTAGQVVAVLLALNLAPRICLALSWALYLSLMTVGSPFLDFQWDNLLLETLFFSWFIAPPGLLRGRRMPPHPFAVFLMQWLLFRLHFESGVAKLLSGDPTWRDLTAIVAYYETAPLPTWLGWYAHQLPMWAHQVTAGLTLLIELILPFFYWGPGAMRRVALVASVAFQLVVAATANYSVFNYLSLALCLFLVDDADFRRWFGWLGIGRGEMFWRQGVLRSLSFGVALIILVPLSTLPFLRFAGMAPAETLPVLEALAPLRTFNVYHLFASMTLERREAVIEGSNDGETWREYVFRYKPGDPKAPPPFVAPHQPRVDFQMWFLLLGRRWGAPYFDRLLKLMLEKPSGVHDLFAKDPFDGAAPRMVRVAIYRYNFTDEKTRRKTGDWWARTLISTSRVRTRDDYGSGG